jgi:hypothetical protein
MCGRVLLKVRCELNSDEKKLTLIMLAYGIVGTPLCAGIGLGLNWALVGTMEHLPVSTGEIILVSVLTLGMAALAAGCAVIGYRGARNLVAGQLLYT